MGRSFTIATFAGIPIKLHWTFGLLIFTLLFLEYRETENLTGVGYMFIYISLLFICVVLHEYGHALTANSYGINTRDIILSPIGGLARLEDIPEAPMKEFWIAIAGPMVNVVIATITGLGIYFLGLSHLPEVEVISQLYNPSGLLQLVFWMNIVLFVFNLIPAFPMDGGRVLRSLLSVWLPRKNATFIAMVIGQIIALGLLVYALLSSQLVLGLIAIFVFYSARQEYDSIALKTHLGDTKVSEIMRTEYTIITNDQSYQEVVDIAQATGEHNFLLEDQGAIIGCIPYPYHLGAEQKYGKKIAAELHDSRIEFVSGDVSVYEVYNAMQDKALSIVAVGSVDYISGVVDRSIIQTYIIAYQRRRWNWLKIFNRSQ